MEEAAVLENTAVFIYNKVFSYIFKRRKIWNPQSEFTSDEEETKVSRLLADGTFVLYLCPLVKGLNEMSL